MPNKKPTEQSTVQKAADKARDAFQKAKDANAKTDNASTKKSLEDARTAMQAAVKAENRERFVNVGTNRTKKARAAIGQLIKVANPKTYEYTAEESAKIVAGLKAKVAEVEKAFTNTGKAATAGDDFSIV